MKCQTNFLGKKKKNIKCHLLKLLPSMLSELAYASREGPDELAHLLNNSVETKSTKLWCGCSFYFNRNIQNHLIDCKNRQQSSLCNFIYVLDDLNLHILYMVKKTFYLIWPIYKGTIWQPRTILKNV